MIDRVRGGGSFWIALAAAVVPVVVAGLRAALGDWRPTSDNTFIAVRAWDVLSANPPLLGTSSSLSEPVGREIYHPGALNFDLLAAPVHFFGHSAGTALGIAAINALAVAGIGWLLLRRLGPAGATVGLAVVTLLVWSMGSQVLVDPWHTHATLLPFALFIVAVWCVAAGDPVAVIALVAAGSYAVQVHLSYVLPVALMTGWVVAVSVACLVRARRDAASWPERRSRFLRWGAITSLTALVCWFQPLAQQFFGAGEGNLTALLRAARVSLDSPSWSEAVTVVGSGVALPPFFLPPTFDSPAFRPDGTGRPLALAALGLVALFGLLAVLGWRAWRRGNVTLAAGAATALVGLGAGLVTVDGMPVLHGVVTFYLRWMWPLGAVVWLVVLLLLADELRTFRLHPGGGLAVVVALVVALVAGGAAVPAVDNGSMSPPWSIDAANDIAPPVIAAVEDEELVIVDLPVAWPVIDAGPPLLAELQEAGIPFRVNQRIVARHSGLHRYADPDDETTYADASVQINVRPGTAEVPAGEELIASWSSLSDAERGELDRLTAVLAEEIGGRGLELHPRAAEVVEDLSLQPDRAVLEAAADDPDALLEAPALWMFVRGLPARHVGHSLVDEASFPSGSLERWAELAEQRDMQQVTVSLHRLN